MHHLHLLFTDIMESRWQTPSLFLRLVCWVLAGLGVLGFYESIRRGIRNWTRQTESRRHPWISMCVDLMFLLTILTILKILPVPVALIAAAAPAALVVFLRLLNRRDYRRMTRQITATSYERYRQEMGG
jgi:hypothetical protein